MTPRGGLWDKRGTSSRRPEEPPGGDVSVRCPSCGHPNRTDRRYCAACGGHLGQACPSCGTRNNPAEKFCGACGAALSGAAAEGERRQLTVLFCDLVGSTAIAGRLDPEDWREIAAEYRRAAAETVTRFGGHVAQYLGDGLLVFFGYPQAHEDDPERAVRGGLALIDTVAELSHRLEPIHGVQLAVRVGMHTGPVVIGEGAAAGAEVFGDTPNVAARVQALADPNAVLITEATHRLVSGRFVVEAKGAPPMKGVRTPVAVYRVVQASGVRSRLAAAGPRGLTPFVGREAERRLLGERWAQARAGEGQVVLITGEAGIGKSRLVQTFKETLAGEPHVWLECVGSPYHQNTPFFQVVDMLQQGLAWRGDESPAERLQGLERAFALAGLRLPEAVPLVAPLLSLPVPDHYPPRPASPEQQRRKLLAILAAWLFGAARVQPIVLVVEDLHWVDPSTLELQGLFVERGATAPVLLLYTARPEFRGPWPLLAHHAQVTLGRLGHRHVREMVAHVAPRAGLAEPVIEAVVTRTDGIPLYVEELTKAVLEADGGGAISARTIPATLQDSLMARLDRLGGAKEVAQVGAVIGREFSYALLHAVSRLPDAELQAALARLTDAELLYPRGRPPEATYVFRHALVQEMAYESLLRSTRSHYHQRVAAVLAEQFPEIAETEPELLAQHFAAAGLAPEAVEYWRRAGLKAIERSANLEATHHLERALETLRGLAEGPERDQLEIELLTARGPALISVRGFTAPEVRRTYERAHGLCRRAEEAPQLFTALWGLWFFNVTSGHLQTGREIAEQFMGLAERQPDPGLLMQAHHMLGPTLCQLGHLTSARAHWEAAIALYDPAQHRAHAALYGGHDPGVCCRVYGALALWMLGFPDLALRRAGDALALVRELEQPTSLALALAYAGMLHQLRRDPESARDVAEAGLAISSEHQLATYQMLTRFTRGWAVARAGLRGDGLVEMQEARAAMKAAGMVIWGSHFSGMIAEVCDEAGRGEAGLAAVHEGLALAEATGETYYVAELNRLRGELLLLAHGDSAAEDAAVCFRRACDIARQQEARSWELRAAMSLARLGQRQGTGVDARPRLAEVYAGFTEGFDTRDLIEAKALLEELG